MESFILDTILENIQSGRFTSDEFLPSEHILASEFKVSRLTIRKVYQKLEEMGYIRSYPGRGRVIQQRKGLIPLDLRGDESFSKKMNQLNLDLHTVNVFSYPCEFNAEIWQKLDAQKDEVVFLIGRLRIIQKEPTAIHLSYIKETLFPEINAEAPEILSMFSYFESKGLKGFSSGYTHMKVVLPNCSDQEILVCPPLIPLLVIETETKDDKNRVIQFSTIKYRTDKFMYQL
jgi:GntR family transcriptional regulator